MAASFTPFSPPPPLSLIFKPKPLYLFPIRTFPSTQKSSRRSSYYLNSPDAFRAKPTRCWKISASNGNFFLSEANPVESSQEIVPTSDDGVTTVISSLLIIAFIGLSILTIGVIYIAVTDFLQKREREKFEKEEAAKKKKKSGKKGKVRAGARGGPRGFGQKIEEDDDDLDEAD